MGNNSNGMGTGKAILLTVTIMVGIGWIMSLGTPKCQKSGCKNDAKEGSNYCYVHDNSYYNHKKYHSTYSGTSGSSGSSSTGSSSSSTNRSSGSSSSSSTTGSGKSSNTGSSSSSQKTYSHYEDTYDKGYEDVYEDGDYDMDRYNHDNEYANGVDDAIEELEEEGEEW